MSTRRSKADAKKKSTGAARKGSPCDLRHSFRVGDRVLVVDISSDLKDPGYHDDPEMRTAELFRFCVGRKFVIRGFDRYGHFELRVDDDPAVKKEFGLNSIWLEPELVQQISKTRRKVKRPASGFGWREDFLAEAKEIGSAKKSKRASGNRRER